MTFLSYKYFIFINKLNLCNICENKFGLRASAFNRVTKKKKLKNILQ